MGRPITLFTGQWADLALEDLARKVSEWGFDGLELACWGDHFEVDRALSEDDYIQGRKDLLAKYNLECHAISNHLVGQCVCDPIDTRHKAILPERIWGNGEPEAVRQRAAAEMKDTARAAKLMGVDVVNGFTGSSLSGICSISFHRPARQILTKVLTTSLLAGSRYLDVFAAGRYSFWTWRFIPPKLPTTSSRWQRALEAVDHHPGLWHQLRSQAILFINSWIPIEFINAFPDRIFHAHVKDSRVQLTGRNSILSSHLDFGDHRRGWDFVSPGRGDVNWDKIVRALNRIGYDGPLSIEWEDSGMSRDWGAPEALANDSRPGLHCLRCRLRCSFQQ